ncbi:MAG TPA: hypothetical protein VKS98_02070 [Chthoniobacterales bacterium]|nr:hypothetical protein [Chthoniobacterales bacterium]
MKKIERSIVILAMIGGLFATSSALAQPGRAAADRPYDPKTVETVQGTVLSVQKMSPPKDRGYGVHLTLQTADNPVLDIHLGPAWYVDKQTPHIEAKDVITVTGSRISIDGQSAIIAAEVQKGPSVLRLRDKNGVPAWSGAGRRDQ